MVTSVGVDQGPHLTLPGVPSQSQLREHERAVHGDFECAARRLDQADLDVPVSSLQLGRQTGGPGIVVSDDAILDADTHGIAPSMIR